MSNETKARAVAWSDAEKFEFLVKVIAQIGGDKTSIKFDLIDMPGRTPKAMTHIWTKIRGDVAAMNRGEVKPRFGGAMAVIPGVDDDDDDDDADGQGPTKKRKATVPRKKAAVKAKTTLNKTTVNVKATVKTKDVTKKAASTVSKSAKKVFEPEDDEDLGELLDESNNAEVGEFSGGPILNL